MKRFALSPTLRQQTGVTALDTAIILVAFVVVASVFAWVVMSAGLFTSQQSGEAVTAAIDQVTNTIELVGDPKADGVLATILSTIDAAGDWTALGNVTISTENLDRKEGSAALDLDIAPQFALGIVAYEDLASTVDLSGHLAAGLWIKSSSMAADGLFQLLLDDTPNCGSPEESLDIGALAADTWVQPRMKLSDPSGLTAVACIAISASADPGPVTLTVDLIRGPPEVRTVYLSLNNTLPTEGISFITTIDTDGDGLLSDEADRRNNLVVTFSNQEQLVRDITWTVSELGAGDGDTDLEYGETFLLTIDLRAVDPIPTTKTLLGLQIAAHGNAFLAIEKRIPRTISVSMILR